MLIKNKKKAISLITDYLYKVFDWGLHESPFSADNSEYFKPKISLDVAPELYEKLIK